jgi:membrane protease YdiL (CAAX protease family)
MGNVPIHRVMERIGMLILAVVTVMFLRKRGLADKATLGYGIARPQFIKQMLFGLAAGILLMLPLTVILFGLNTLELSPQFMDSTAPVVYVGRSIVLGLLAGFGAAFIEETFCRGAMFSTIRRESGLLLAIVLPALLYAATHFLGGRLRIPPEQVTYVSGLEVVLNLFQRFATPLAFVDSFAALAALGILLALVRLRTGAIAGGVGLHAGGAAVIWVLNDISQQNTQSPLLWLAGSYRGMIGWLACVWIAIVAIGYWRITRPKLS